MPPMQQIPQGFQPNNNFNFSTKKKGWYASLNPKKKAHLDKILIYMAVLIFVILPAGIIGIFILRRMMATPDPTATTPTAIAYQQVDVLATLTAIAPTTNPNGTSIPEPTLALEYIAATATAQAVYAKPAIDYSKYRLLVGSIRLDKEFGFCQNTNIGFVASGTPYFLKMDVPQLPNQDLFSLQAQVSGYVEIVPNCQYPLVRVKEIKYIGGRLDADVRLAVGGGDSYSYTITNTTNFTLTQVNDPNVAPTTTNPYLKDVPYHDQNGNVLPTATPITFNNSINIFGRMTAISGCVNTNFGIATASGELLVEFAGAAFPPSGNPTGQEVIAVGTKTEICGRAAIRATSIQYQANNPGAAVAVIAQQVAAELPKPTKTPTPTATPIKVNKIGTLVQVGDCPETSFGLKTDFGEVYYLVFDTLNTEIDKRVALAGTLVYNSCGSTIKVAQLSVQTTPTPTASPSPTFTPTPTASATASPTATITPTIPATATASPTPSIPVEQPINKPIEENGGGEINGS